jgi:hypothetical protein
MNLFSVEIRRMQQAGANLMRRLAQVELARKGAGLVKAHKIVGPDGSFDRKDRRLKAIVVTGKCEAPGINAIYSILREHLQNPTGRERIAEEIKQKTKSPAEFRSAMKSFTPDQYAVDLMAEFEDLMRFLNEPVFLVNAVRDNPGEGWYILTGASPLRNIANALIDYLEYFKTPGMLEHDPIALCPRCDSLFLKAKSTQEFCSTRCRVAQWGKQKGKDYFREKQAEFRASLKVQEEKLKNNTLSAPRRHR